MTKLQVIVAGGRNEDGALSSTEALDPTNRKWTRLEPTTTFGSVENVVPPDPPYFEAPLPTTRNSGAAANLGGNSGGSV